MEGKSLIRAVVFDFDGLTLDTETPWYESLQQVYAKYGISFPEELFNNAIGASHEAFNPYGYLADQLQGQPDERELRTEVHELFLSKMEKQKLREGVLDYLIVAKRTGLKIGLASSSPRAWVESYLKKYEIYDYYECIYTADDVEQVKPDPALYRLALKQLGVEGHETIAFEDSVNGLTAAKAAGLYGVAVPNALTHRLPFTIQDVMLMSMADLPLEVLIQRIEELDRDRQQVISGGAADAEHGRII